MTRNTILILLLMATAVGFMSNCSDDTVGGQVSDDCPNDPNFTCENFASDETEEGGVTVVSYGSAENETSKDSYCTESYGCETGQTCFDEQCHESCFDAKDCGEDACFWSSSGTAECKEPWTCVVDLKQLDVEPGACRIPLNCSSGSVISFSFECKNQTCQCLENGKVVGEIPIPADREIETVCSSVGENFYSYVNTHCQWAIAPR